MNKFVKWLHSDKFFPERKKPIDWKKIIDFGVGAVITGVAIYGGYRLIKSIGNDITIGSSLSETGDITDKISDNKDENAIVMDLDGKVETTDIPESEPGDSVLIETIPRRAHIRNLSWGQVASEKAMQNAEKAGAFIDGTRQTFVRETTVKRSVS